MRELRYRVLDVVEDIIHRGGVNKLSNDERCFWAVLYSWGVIKNEGLHGYVFWFDEHLTREMAVDAFIDLDLAAVAEAIVDSGFLSIDYVNATPEEDLSSRGFRKAFDEQLSKLEKIIYSLEPEIDRQLEKLALRIAQKRELSFDTG